MGPSRGQCPEDAMVLDHRAPLSLVPDQRKGSGVVSGVRRCEGVDLQRVVCGVLSPIAALPRWS